MTKKDFSNLVSALSRRLFGIAYRILRNREGSEDAVQEVFIKLWKMNEKLNEYESVEALAITMTKNYCVDQVRRQKFTDPAEVSSFSLSMDSEPSVQQKLEMNETSLLLDKIIKDLPEIYRQIIQLRDIEGISYEKIAERTGQNINTLRVNLSRARKLVRDEYESRINETR